MAKKRTKRPKKTPHEVGARIDTVKIELLKGKTYSEIVPYASEWGISERQVCTYIIRAKEEIAEINQEEFKSNRGLILRNLWKTYTGAVDSKNWNAASNLLGQLSKIYGLDQVTIKHEITRHSDIPDEELMAGLNQFEGESEQVH